MSSYMRWIDNINKLSVEKNLLNTRIHLALDIIEFIKIDESKIELLKDDLYNAINFIPVSGEEIRKINDLIKESGE